VEVRDPALHLVTGSQKKLRKDILLMQVINIYSILCGSLKGFDSTILDNTIERILGHFSELKDVRSLLYFNHSISLGNIVATMYPLEYPNSGLPVDHPELELIYQQYINLDFFFYFTRIVTKGDLMARVINISHEFQHASQYTVDKKIYMYGCIIRHMLEDLISEVRSPIEYDAERKSKIIAYDLCGDRAVNELIESMLSNPDVPREFWEVLKSINIQEEFDLKNKILELWEDHKIEEKIQQLKKSRIKNYDQKKVIEMYNFANT